MAKNMKKYQNVDELPAVLNADDIKWFLGIGRKQSYELLGSGQFHIVKIGRTIRVSKPVFVRWFHGETA